MEARLDEIIEVLKEEILLQDFRAVLVFLYAPMGADGIEEALRDALEGPLEILRVREDEPTRYRLQLLNIRRGHVFHEVRAVIFICETRAEGRFMIENAIDLTIVFDVSAEVIGTPDQSVA